MGNFQGRKTRDAQRFPLQLPVTVVAESLNDHTETLNISSAGALFYVNAGIKVGSKLDFAIHMPREVLGTPRDVVVNCAGRVIRCSRIRQRHAVAVIIDEYDFQRC